MVCPPDHKHGTNHTCYVQHKCRCEPCADHHSAAQRKLIRDHAKEAWGVRQPDWVDAELVRAHIRNLGSAGIGQPRLAELAGVDEKLLGRVLYGHTNSLGFHPPSRRVRRDTAEAILAIEATIENRHPLAPGLDARGTHRRIQALVMQGWSTARQSQYLGVDLTSVQKYLRKRTIQRRTHDRVVAMFAELWDKTPPLDTPGDRNSYVQAIRYAARRGWVGPLAWDDIDNDPKPVRAEPESRRDFVDEVVVELACNGHRPRRLSRAELRLVIRVLHSRQFGDPLIAERAGVSDREVVRIRKHELGLPPVAYGESVHRRVA
jgi:hypothetical protein